VVAVSLKKKGALLGIVLIVVSLLGGHDGAGGPEAAVSTSEGGSG
jgi:hypothetical protein